MGIIINKYQHLRLIVSLGITQIIAWASSYYLPAVLARPMAEGLGVSAPTVYASFSAALIASALTLPVAGKCVDKWGGKRVLAFSNTLFALSLGFLSQTQSEAGLFCGWTALGVAMGAGLYDMAFAAVVRTHGKAAPPIIIGITLICGFASTVGWPLSHYILSDFGWRQVLLTWGGAHLFLALPLNLSLSLPIREVKLKETDNSSAEKSGNLPAMLALAAAFVFSSACASAMAGHMPGLLRLFGISAATSVLASMTFGPAQVAARIVYIFILRKLQPATTAILAVLTMPAGSVALIALGGSAALFVGMTHGFGNGIMSIIKGTLPLSVFGEKGYGKRQGLLLMPAGIAQALAPFGFSLCIDNLGQSALLAYIAACCLAGLFFWLLKRIVKRN